MQKLGTIAKNDRI